MRAFSTEELQAAFQRARKPGWPATLEVALQHPLHAALIRTEALLIALPPRGAAAAQSLTRSEVASLKQFISGRKDRFTASFPDRKRLAAGDRDDD